MSADTAATTRSEEATPAGGIPRPTGRSVSSTRQASFTVPSMSVEHGHFVTEVLQERLISLLDLGLTLKHVHWNVVGPSFMAVHEMLDPQYAGVQKMSDDVAERIATLGGVPNGLPGHLVETRWWDDYALDRANAIHHLGALDLVYQGVIREFRDAINGLSEVDPVSHDLLIGQAAVLERYHWFVRSHLTDWAGGVANAGATNEMDAARAVADKSSDRRRDRWRRRDAQGLESEA